MNISQDKLASLFRDGISEDLYKLLWSKDELNFGPPINIPDTILYKFGQPTTWYFTSLNGSLKKKNKSNLISAKIEEVFNKHVLGYDVLAYFISFPNELGELNSNSNVTVEYFDRTALNDFLYRSKKPWNGILQRFIEPKTTHNEVIRAIWSPKVCLLERAENIHQLHDQRYGLYERCVIYEGPEYYYSSAPLRGPVLSGQIQKLCESTVAHVSEVTFGQKQISRMVLNFKVDSRDKIWLLYSTSIRCTDMLEYVAPSTMMTSELKLSRTVLNIDSVISLPNNVSLNPFKSYGQKIFMPKPRIICLSCCQETLEELRHPVTYKSIIKHYEHILHIIADLSGEENKANILVNWPPDFEIIEAAGGVGFGCLHLNEREEVMTPSKLKQEYLKPKHFKDIQIPPILSHLHPKLNLSSYQRCRKDPIFLYKSANLCESCFLVYAEFTTILLQMGQDLSKLLTPDPAAASLLEKSGSKHFVRPSSADWRAISTVNQSRLLSSSQSSPALRYPDGSLRNETVDTRLSHNYSHAKESAIGLRTSDSRQPPEIPKIIRSAHENEALRDMMGNKQKSTFSAGDSPSKSIGVDMPSSFGSLSGTYEPDEVQAIIAERERRFFKEISLNPQLKDQHPLMHLISAQQKLQLVDQQSGILSSKAAQQTESKFGAKYGKQTGDHFQKFGAYSAEVPYVLNGVIVLPSQLSNMRKAERERKRQKLRQQLLVDELNRSASKSPKNSLKSKSGASMEARVTDSHATPSHVNYLSHTLQKVETEMNQFADHQKMVAIQMEEKNKEKELKALEAKRLEEERIANSPTKKRLLLSNTAPTTRSPTPDMAKIQNGETASDKSIEKSIKSSTKTKNNTDASTEKSAESIGKVTEKDSKPSGKVAEPSVTTKSSVPTPSKPSKVPVKNINMPSKTSQPATNSKKMSSVKSLVKPSKLQIETVPSNTAGVAKVNNSKQDNLEMAPTASEPLIPPAPTPQPFNFDLLSTGDDVDSTNWSPSQQQKPAVAETGGKAETLQQPMIQNLPEHNGKKSFNSFKSNDTNSLSESFDPSPSKPEYLEDLELDKVIMGGVGGEGGDEDGSTMTSESQILRNIGVDPTPLVFPTEKSRLIDVREPIALDTTLDTTSSKQSVEVKAEPVHAKQEPVPVKQEPVQSIQEPVFVKQGESMIVNKKSSDAPTPAMNELSTTDEPKEKEAFKGGEYDWNMIDDIISITEYH